MVYHNSILTNEILDLATTHINNQENTILIDGTIGDGGHSLALLQHFPHSRLVGSDRDLNMLNRAKQRLLTAGITVQDIKPVELDKPPIIDSKAARVHLYHGSFHQIANFFPEECPVRPKLILLDLGVAHHHFKEANRGFSFHDDCLDMRFDANQKLSAADIVNHCPSKKLAQILQNFGEEPYAFRLAKAIVKERPFSSAHALGQLIAKHSPSSAKKNRRIHPATRVFQALRIATNNELEILQSAMEELPYCLAPGGILSVISFHSLEDRLVKQSFKKIGVSASKKAAKQSHFAILTPKPIFASKQEVEKNRLARSARLRALLAQRGT